MLHGTADEIHIHHLRPVSIPGYRAACQTMRRALGVGLPIRRCRGAHGTSGAGPLYVSFEAVIDDDRPWSVVMCHGPGRIACSPSEPAKLALEHMRVNFSRSLGNQTRDVRGEAIRAGRLPLIGS